MKYIETGFRPIYHQFTVFPLTDAVRGAIRDFPGENSAEGVLTWGYYDPQAGLTLEVLACARTHGDAWQFADSNPLVRSFLRIDAVAGEDFDVILDKKDTLKKRYANKLEVLKAYDAEKAVEKSRTFAFLDDSRHPKYIDDVQVFLGKEGLKPELCWARIIDLGDRRIWAKLLNEPDQDFGIHEGEDFTFFVHEDEETKKVTCHALFSPQTKIKPEDFADGSLLKEAIHHYLEDPEGDALFDLMQILRDCDVWIPCSAVIGEEDQEAMEKMIEEAGDDLESMVGKEITAQDNIRLVPDILENDGKYFFPAFASEEDMGEYGEGFSQIQESFMTVMDLARTTQHEGKDLTGIVINAFTEPFVLPKELFEAVERMVSRIE